MKEIDLSKTLYELVAQYPEIQEIMSQLGFTAINQNQGCCKLLDVI